MNRNATNSNIPGLIADLGDESAPVRETAHRRLVSLGAVAVPSLVEALAHLGEYGRAQAAEVLGEIGDPAALPALVQAMQDEKFDVRWLAAKAIVPFGRVGLTALLHALRKHPESLFLRQGAHHVLRNEGQPRWQEPLAPVKRALESPDPEDALPGAVAKALADVSATK